MARKQPRAASHLRVVASSTNVTAPGAWGATTQPRPNASVLAGLLLCADGGHAVGVVREVLAWDGQQLSLRVTLDPGTTFGLSDVTIQVPLAICPGVASEQARGVNGNALPRGSVRSG